MNLTWTDEQKALRDSAERFLAERYTQAMRAAPGSAWSSLAGLGWLGLPIADAYGGADGTALDVSVLTEAMGRQRVSEPYISAIVLSAGLIDACGSDTQKAAWLPRIVEGACRIACALEEGADPLSMAPTTRAEVHDGQTRLAGRKTAILDAAIATDGFLVTARLGATGGVGVYHVAAATPGMHVAPFATVDGRSAATLVLDQAVGHRLGTDADSAAAIATMLDRAVAAQCADMLGAMTAALDATVAYAKVRNQFGRPIGANQVIKHRLVEMAIRVEEARSSALAAAIRCSDGSGEALRSRAVSGAKVKLAKTARAVTEDAVQIHGAMGVTEELDIGGYLQRSIAFDAVLGTPKQHRQRYAALANAAL